MVGAIGISDSFSHCLRLALARAAGLWIQSPLAHASAKRQQRLSEYNDPDCRISKGADAMLSAEGCRRRRERLWANLDPPPESDYVLLSDPIHLVYFANYWVDPISLGAGFPGYLLIRKDGHGKLLHDNKAPKSTQLAHADETRSITWYDGQSPAVGPRQLAVMREVNPMRSGLRVHDRPGDPMASEVVNTGAEMRT